MHKIEQKKKFGQNFLTDQSVIERIVSIAGQLENKSILEIGGGSGNLTKHLIKAKPKNLIVVEIDKDYVKILSKILQSSSVKTTLISEDILKTDIYRYFSEPPVIFGNLPYNISSQILVKILKFSKWPPKFKNLVLMFQKELGDKIIGQYSTSDYSRLSILSNLRLKNIKKFLVSPNCFFPKPKVNSLVIHFQPKPKSRFYINDINNLEKVTNILFSNKRKMINKNIKRILNQSQVDNISNLNLNSRPSDLSPEIYYKITEFFERR